MSLESQPTTGDLPAGENSISTTERTGSSKKLWLLGGCGCFTLIVFLIIGLGVFAWIKLYKPLQDFTTENITLATSSQELQDIIGDPVETGVAVPNRTEDSTVIEMAIPVSGSKGSGTIVLRGKLEAEEDGNFRWVRESMHLDFDGQQTDLNPEKELIPELDIDFGI